MDDQQPAIVEEEVKPTKRDAFAWLVERGFGILGIGIGASLTNDSSGIVMILAGAVGGGAGGGLGYLVGELIRKKRR